MHPAPQKSTTCIARAEVRSNCMVHQGYTGTWAELFLLDDGLSKVCHLWLGCMELKFGTRWVHTPDVGLSCINVLHVAALSPRRIWTPIMVVGAQRLGVYPASCCPVSAGRGRYFLLRLVDLVPDVHSLIRRGWCCCFFCSHQLSTGCCKSGFRTWLLLWSQVVCCNSGKRLVSCFVYNQIAHL